MARTPALSPAVNDPTTCLQALDTIDGLLRILATRDLSVEHISTATAASASTGTTDMERLPRGRVDQIIALPGLSANVSRRILKLLDELQ